MQNKILIELNYLAPVAYYALIGKYKNVCIEAQESFIKSSYRNRCEILGANGRQMLSVPIKGGRSHSQAYKDVAIDNSQNWQNKHWQAIQSAYGRSPYFEHYSMYFEKFYQKKWNNLFDFNLELLKTTTKLLKIKTAFSLTEEFEKEVHEIDDFRSMISPKKAKDKSETLYTHRPYLQVFNDRFAFEAKLSIVDLLFNEGPNAGSYL